VCEQGPVLVACFETINWFDFDYHQRFLTFFSFSFSFLFFLFLLTKVENAIELLDAPEEFYYDEVERVLYLAYNGTGAPPTTTKFVVPTLKRLINVVGTQSAPVTDVAVLGVGFRDAAYT
jgi:hypothetical protein